MNMRYYSKNGFDPTILTVHPALIHRNFSSDLVLTIPESSRVIYANAFSASKAKLFGVTDIAIRAMTSIARTGDKLLSSESFDLIFFSTTAFLLMQLGARWRRKYDVPFVLDLQDPWFTAPSNSVRQKRKGVKHSLMRRLHARAEASTVPYASGLIAVTADYIEVLSDTYPEISMIPTATIPFGYSKFDFDVATTVGTPWLPFTNNNQHSFVALYAGRVESGMYPALNTLFAAMKATFSDKSCPLHRVNAGFLGTGYLREGNPHVVMPFANALGLASRIVERPDRVSLLDSLSSIMAADILIILGSTDYAYQPSKLYQLMSTGKPILCVAPSSGRLASKLRGLKSVVFLDSERTLSQSIVNGVANHLFALLSSECPSSHLRERDAICNSYDSSTLAAQECSLFEQAVKHYETAPLRD